MIALTDREFLEITGFMKLNYGIDLMKKRQLIESRMHSVLIKKGIGNFTDYFNLIKSMDQNEISILINKLTTNHTYFNREPKHFDFLRDVILPRQKKNNLQKNIRIWSAGCSSGEEAYTAVMILHDFFSMEKSKWDYRILATDISTDVLTAAKNTVYNQENLKDIPPAWIKRYFKYKGENQYVLSFEVLNEVMFKTFNLMDKFPYTNSFDLIFCRNVMIYFDQQTKANLINKFYDALKPGGYLFIGHSESIQHIQNKFTYIQPSIYQKGSVNYDK